MVAADEAVVELVELEFEDVSSAGSKANDLFHWSSSMNFWSSSIYRIDLKVQYDT